MEPRVFFLLQSCSSRHESGLFLSLLEPVEAAYCNQTVEEGDTLYVDYEVEDDDDDADDDDDGDTLYVDYEVRMRMMLLRMMMMLLMMMMMLLMMMMMLLMMMIVMMMMIGTLSIPAVIFLHG